MPDGALIRAEHHPLIAATIRAMRPPVVDVGGGHRWQKAMAFYRDILPTYWPVDADPATRPAVVAAAECLPFHDRSLGGVVCNSCLEHLAAPWQAVAEIRRALAPGAPVAVTVPFRWPYHAKPGHYEDYYRFTEAGLRALFGGFADVQTATVTGCDPRDDLNSMTVLTAWAPR